MVVVEGRAGLGHEGSCRFINKAEEEEEEEEEGADEGRGVVHDVDETEDIRKGTWEGKESR